MAGRQKDYLEGAILAVDAVGYSRLMGKDEEGKQLTQREAPTKKLVDVESVFHKWMAA